jgi:hypothetical protein
MSNDSRPNSCFADTLNRKYPIDSPASAYESMSYATKTASVEPHVINRIQKALDIYGVSAPIAETVKEAAAVEEVVYVLPQYNKLPVKTASDIKLAEDAILRNKSKLHTTTLAQACNTLVKLAGMNNMNVHPDVMQLAGLTMSDTEKTADWIEARGSITGNRVFFKLADRVRGPGGPKNRSDLVKLSSAVDKMDKMYDLDKLYGKKIPNPLETVFSTKTSMQKIIDLGAKEHSLDELAKKPVSFYSDLLGEDIAEEISEDGEVIPELLAQVLPTLPKDMKDLLCKNLY